MAGRVKRLNDFREGGCDRHNDQQSGLEFNIVEYSLAHDPRMKTQDPKTQSITEGACEQRSK